MSDVFLKSQVHFLLSEDDWIYCPSPGRIENGQFTYLPNLNNRRSPQTSQGDPEYPEGGRLQFSCNEGYVLQGSSVVECQETGDWSNNPPTCRKSKCPSLDYDLSS